MSDVLTNYNSAKLWQFDGGLHLPDMKSQSNSRPIRTALLADNFYVPVKQHSGTAGNILVKVGDKVLRGQALTQGDGLRVLPVHSPTSGIVKAIEPYIAAHPSGLSELAIHIQADGEDRWRSQYPIEDYFTQSPEQLIQRIYQAGVAGLGGAVFPTAAKINAAQNKVKLLIINGAECEPYISCDDRLMRDYADEIIEGCRILRYILRPEKIVIAIEDNKPEAINAVKKGLQGANDIDLRVIPTKYPSGDSDRLIYILTGMEVPAGERASSIGVMMQNVGTVFAIKRAIIDDEPLIERVVTLTGDKIPHKGNQWVRLGTPISFILEQAGYQPDPRFPVYLGGPMMGLAIPNLDAPVTKLSNCLLAPDHFEYQPPAKEQSCIRCSACSDACPVHLLPQQLYWFARAEEHQKAQDHQLMDCIECGICAYVCPSHIPLIQYFRQQKATIWDIEQKARKSEEAKIRFEARQARLEKEEQARKQRAQQAAQARREEVAASNGEDPVKAALERLKAKKANEAPITKTKLDENAQLQPDNKDLMAERQARRLARQQNNLQSSRDATLASDETQQNQTALAPQKAAVAAAIARAKAKKQEQATQSRDATLASDETPQNQTALDPKKAAVAAAIARAKAKKQEQAIQSRDATLASDETPQNQTALDPQKAAVAAAIARAKAKKQEQAIQSRDAILASDETPQNQTALDPQKAAVAAAIARAKAKKLEQATQSRDATLASDETPQNQTALDPKKAAVAAAIARAKAKKQAQQANKE